MDSTVHNRNLECLLEAVVRSGKQVRYKKQMVFVACYTGVVVGSWIHKSRGRPKEKKLSFAEIDFVQHDLAIDNLDHVFTVH